VSEKAVVEESVIFVKAEFDAITNRLAELQSERGLSRPSNFRLFEESLQYSKVHNVWQRL
jgi:hypothetical protein